MSKIQRAGYAADYTSEPVDFVFIIGPDNPGETTHAELCQQVISSCKAKGLGYVILGDGKTRVDLNEIKKLPKANNACIYGHGNGSGNKHRINLYGNKLENSIDIMQSVQDRDARQLIESAMEKITKDHLQSSQGIFHHSPFERSIPASKPVNDKEFNTDDSHPKNKGH